jgi:hypothetical protein
VSIPDRIIRISKAYISQVRQRIDDELAERELDSGAGSPVSGDSGAAVRNPTMKDDPVLDAADEMMRRAEERIAAARRDMEGRGEISPSGPAEYDRGASANPALPTSPSAPRFGAPPPPPTSVGGSGMNSSSGAPADPNATDYVVLGVPVGSDLSVVQSAYEKLARRLDSTRFVGDPSAQNEASRILDRVNVSYEKLRNRLDPTQNRFGKLELE